MLMKYFILVLLLSPFAYADECIFDETAYIDFIEGYVAKNKNAKLVEENTLIVDNADEQLVIKGGGCEHLGGNIELKSNQKLSEAELLSKVTLLAETYASWLIDINELKSAIKNKSWDQTGSFYRFVFNEITVLEIFQEEEGNIDISFYIN
jgi:hypothetical protein